MMNYINLMELSDTYGVLAVLNHQIGEEEKAKEFKKLSDEYKARARNLVITYR